MIAVTKRTEARTNTSPQLRLASSCSGDSTWNRGTPSPSTPSPSTTSPSIDDDGLRDVVERHLQMSNYRPVRAVGCSVVDGVVTLFGMLPSFYLKQVAQAIVYRVEAVIRVENHCGVVYPHQAVSAPASSGDSQAGEARSSTTARPVEEQAPGMRANSSPNRPQ